MRSVYALVVFFCLSQALHALEVAQGSFTHNEFKINDYKEAIDKFIGHKEVKKLKDLIYFPITYPLDHTMGNSINNFVDQKMPQKEIAEALKNACDIKVVGLGAEVFEYYAKNILEIDSSKLKKIAFNHNPRVKDFNFRRPSFYTYKDEKRCSLYVSVISGDDYILHYASMVRHLASRLTAKSMDEIISIIKFPEMNKNLAIWTGLDSSFIKEGDLVIMGHVNDMRYFFNKNSKLKMTLLETKENYYYGSSRYKVNNIVINFLGSKHSYWGDMAGIIANQLLHLGASEIIYTAKLGTLISPKDIYQKIYSARNYIHFFHDKVQTTTIDVRNRFLEYFPEYGVNLHLSIPTILEEDYLLRGLATALGVSSIDNEISRIANNVSEFNKAHNKKIPFASIHFATDYLRGSGEELIATEHDLSNNRTSQALQKKEEILKKISSVLEEYVLKISTL